METTTNREGNMFTDQAQAQWDSESHSSPYSTVSDPRSDDDYCEECDTLVNYTTSNPHGTCKCDH